MGFKPFDQMTPADYAAIGLKCGLEVHQQLRTDRKLFCRCPSGRYSHEFDAEVLRHMRPTLSELGEYDGTALMEKKTNKNIHYRIHHATVCTYEFDDTPPFLPDPRAIDIAVEISLLCNLNLVGEMHIARKQYLDGSIPTGFQRTAILGVSGWIPYGDRRIGITQLSLEEDSCREVSDVGHDRVLLTDRLGMPLIEVVTDPDMRTPSEVAEVCEIIRLLCRGTGHVRTGYGATREDVNVSVRGGTRIEIKGVPQITRIPLLIYNEAMRQCALLDIRDELKRRGIDRASVQWTTHDVTRVVSRTPYEPVRQAVDAGRRVACVVLKGFGGLMNHPTQEHTTFAKEFSDRVRVIACLSTLPNIVHSDTAADMLNVRDWKSLRRRTRAAERDALVLVWGSEADTHTACNEIAIRACEAAQGVPSDTRQAFKDGTTGFERVLPGAERMYPDTDLPPMVLTAERVERVRAALPERIWDRLERLKRLALPADVLRPLCISPRVGLFDRLVGELGTDPTFASVILIQRFKALRRAGLAPDRLTDDAIFAVFQAHAQGRLAREGVLDALTRLLRCSDDDGRPIEEAGGVAAKGADDAGSAPDPALDVQAVLDQTAHHEFDAPQTRHRCLMGLLMHRWRGRVSGTDLAVALARAMGMHATTPARSEARS